MIKDTGRCFACGKDNPRGLQLDVRKGPDGVEFDYVPETYLEGWNDVVHGGIVATLLDELMGWACSARGIPAVTAELNVRFRKPLRPGKLVHGFGRVLSERSRLVCVESRLTDQSGAVVAEASGKMIKV